MRQSFNLCNGCLKKLLSFDMNWLKIHCCF